MAKLVIIDDNPAMLKVLSMTLRGEGRSITTYQEPREAVAAILDAPPDLVVTDLSMPGMSGHDVIEALRRRYNGAQLPIIVVSAVGLEDAILKAFRLGADDYLVKPFEHAELRAKVARMVTSREPAAPVTSPAQEAKPGAESVIGELGRYDLLALLGEGGMGSVYRARERHSGRIVALKVLSNEHAADETLLQRFLREAAILKTVDHPNITAFYDLQHHSGRYFFAMEHVDGKDLEYLVETRGAFDQAFVREFLAQAAEALGYLHSRSLVHRDIKPSNFLWEERRHLFKLTDFGLTLRRSDHRLTQPGILMGTLEFFAPEQITGSLSPDIRSDLFSLGSTAYYLLAADFPFTAKEDQTVLRLVAKGEFVPLSRRVAHLDPALEACIHRMMARDPGQRPQEPRAILDLLEGRT